MEFYSELAEFLGKHAENLGTGGHSSSVTYGEKWLHTNLSWSALAFEFPGWYSDRILEPGKPEECQLSTWKLEVHIENVHFYSSYVLSYKSKGVAINLDKNYPLAVSVFSNENQLFMCISGVVPFPLKFVSILLSGYIPNLEKCPLPWSVLSAKVLNTDVIPLKPGWL